MSTAPKAQLTDETAALLDRTQSILSQLAQTVLPPEAAAEFEAEMQSARAEKFVEPESSEKRSESEEQRADRLRSAEATYTYLKALDTPQEVLDGFRAGKLIAEVSIELTPA